jgi:ATP-dependent RNA helicase DHX36
VKCAHLFSEAKKSSSKKLSAAVEHEDFQTEVQNIGNTRHVVSNQKYWDSQKFAGHRNSTSSTMLRNSIIDERLKVDFLVQRNEHQGYLKMISLRQSLPSYEKRAELIKLIESNQVVVISGETGCGKTTQVPQFILDEALEKGEGSITKIVCTQPRRISALSVAERVAEERGEKCGEKNSSVGYQIRLEKKLPRQEGGSILYCTTGIVLEWMAGGDVSKCLHGVSHLIIDEVHERDIHTDFLMAIVKETLKNRPDFRLVLMSATLNADAFSKYFSATSFNIPGFTHPVKEFYLEDVIEMTNFQIKSNRKDEKLHKSPYYKHTKKGQDALGNHRDYKNFIEPFLRDISSSGTYSRNTIQSLSLPSSEDINIELIATLIHHIHHKQNEGAILVFLPGWSDISELNKLLTNNYRFQFKNPRSVEIHPLHSMMPTINQKKIFTKPPKGVRKIVIATNIAETSITIDDVVYVIDTGKIKLTKYNASDNISTLLPEWVSLANARQRRGRAGRVQPGICYHLFSRAREMTLEQYAVPEILRTRLEEVILKIKVLELGKATPFLNTLMDSPDETVIRRAIDMLVSINALHIDRETENLTPLGYHLAKLPMDPQTGKMILFGAMFSCLDPILSVAASLSFKDPFIVPLGKESVVDAKRVDLSRNTKSDHLMLANVIAGWEDALDYNEGHDYCWDNYLSESTLRMLNNMKEQFVEHLYRSKFINSKDVKALDSNRNSNNEALVRSVICAGLYPNVARIINISRKGARLSTSNEKRLSIHLKSVNAKENIYRYPWLVYHEKLKSNGINLLDCGMVSPLALIFFGKYMKLSQKQMKYSPDIGSHINTIIIDDFVTFDCDDVTANMIRKLRLHLDNLIEGKINYPGVSNWDPKNKEGTVLMAIVKLLSLEVLGVDNYTRDENYD